MLGRSWVRIPASYIVVKVVLMFVCKERKKTKKRPGMAT